MPFTERKILFIANEIRAQCLELYRYLDCVYHKREYVSKIIVGWESVSKKPHMGITFRGRDIGLAISEYHKGLLQSSHYAERFSAKAESYKSHYPYSSIFF